MTPAGEREAVLRRQLERIEERLEGGGWNLDEWAGQGEVGMAGDVPVSLAELERVLTTTPGFRERFRPHPQMAKVYWSRDEGDGEVAVTLDPAVYDAHPETVRLLTPGSPLPEAVLGQAARKGEEVAVLGPFLRLEAEGPLERVGYYALDGEGRPRPVCRLAEVLSVLDGSGSGGGWTEAAIEAARQDFSAHVEEEWAWIRERWERLERAGERAQAARAARMLVQAALIELALGRQPDLRREEAYPTAFDRAAVLGLRRHGYPWTALLRLAQGEIEAPSPADPFFLEIQGETQEQLRERWERLRQRAEARLEEIGRAG